MGAVRFVSWHRQSQTPVGVLMLTAAELEAIVERACTAAVERVFQRQAGATGAFVRK